MLAFSSSCAARTKYDKLEISKIASFWREGFGLSREFRRVFDFENNTVIDTIVFDNEFVESLPEEEKNNYNKPKEIASFEEEQEKKFIRRLKSLGVYSWKAQYVESVCDSGSEILTIYFTDGSIKSTYFYAKFPSTYDKVSDAFETYLGVNMYLDW